MRSILHVLLQASYAAVKLVAAVLLVSTAAKAVGHGGAWYALAALCILAAAGAVLMAGINVWVAWHYLSGRPIDAE